MYDVFISYRHARKSEVVALCEHLSSAGLTYFRDEERRDDDVSIQRGIEAGLAVCKLFLAWYDPTYLQSKACGWELSRALLAAHAGAGLERIVCVDPSRKFSHIVPEALADRAHLVSLDDPSNLVELLRKRADGFDQPLGSIAAGAASDWHGRDRPTHPTWVGRGRELIELFHLLDRGRLAMHGGERAPVAITGWGGEGKTMLAEQYALRFAPAYPAGVVWLSGATEEGVVAAEGSWQRHLENTLAQVARGRLDIPVDELLKGMTDPVQRIRALKDAIDQQLRARLDPAAPPSIAPYLWIVDELPDRLSAKDQHLWLPPDEQAHCIATLREAGGVGAVFHNLQVPALDMSEALQMLTRLRPPTYAGEHALADQIVEALGRLPLALDLGAALVQARGYLRYVELLRAPSTAALDRLVHALGTALPTGHEQSIVKTFVRSLDLLPGSDDVDASPEQRASWVVLRLAALLAPQPLPDVFVRRVLRVSGFDGTDAEVLSDVALATLQRAAVVRRVGTGPFVGSGIHPLLARTVLEVRLGGEHRSRVLERSIAAASQWLKEEQAKAPADSDARVLAITLGLAQRAPSSDGAALANRGGILAMQMGRLRDAIELFEESRAVFHSLLGEEHPSTLTSISNLAWTMQAQGNLPGARALQEQVLVVRRRALGEKHPDTLGSMNNLAATMQAQGNLPGARLLQEQVLVVRRRVLGEEHPDTLGSVGSVGGSIYARRLNSYSTDQPIRTIENRKTYVAAP